MHAFIIAALALSSALDPKVKLVKLEPSSANQWPALQLNQYCYEPGVGITAGNIRTAATLDIMGQLAALAHKHGVMEKVMFQTYSKNKEGANVPRLSCGIRPETLSAAAAEEEVESLMEKALAKGFDLAKLPANNSAAKVILRNFLAKDATQEATKNNSKDAEGPPATSDEFPG